MAKIQNGLPWWLSGKEYTCQCRRQGFDPWVRKTPWRKKWQPTPVFLPGKSHGHRSLAGYSPWGCKRVGYDLLTEQQQQHLQRTMSPNVMCWRSVAAWTSSAQWYPRCRAKGFTSLLSFVSSYEDMKKNLKKN